MVYLGHVVSERDIVTDPYKVAAVREWGRPSNLMDDTLTNNYQEELTGTWEKQVQAITLFSETTGKKLENLQGQPEADLGRILGHVVARTVPVEHKIDPSSFEFKILVSLNTTM